MTLQHKTKIDARLEKMAKKSGLPLQTIQIDFYLSRAKHHITVSKKLIAKNPSTKHNRLIRTNAILAQHNINKAICFLNMELEN